MTSTDPSDCNTRRDNLLACGIIAFCLGWLCLMLGWAQGVRKDTYYLHIPETGGWLIATLVFAVVGCIFFIWSRGAKRG